MSFAAIIRKFWDAGLAAGAALAGAVWLTRPVIDSVTTEVIAFFTIQAAVIFPAMIFTAGLLRGDGLTLDEIDRYRIALRKQMSFWTALLYLDLLTVATLTIGKAAHWKWQVAGLGYSLDLGPLLVGVAVLTGTLAVLRMVPFVKGVMSLLELNVSLVKKAVEAREHSDANTEGQVEPLNLPEGYGRILPHRTRPRKSRKTN